MTRTGRAPRAISLILDCALILTSLGTGAWAQTALPRVGDLSVPVDGASAAAASGEALVGEGAASAPAMTAESLTSSPPALPAAVAPSVLPAQAVRQTAPLHAASAAAPEIATGDRTQPSASGPERLDTRAYWDSHRAGLLSRAQELKERLEEYSHRRELEVTPAEFAEELAKNKVSAKDPQVGTAEMTLVDGRRFIRVVHSGTELSFLFLDADSISRGSKHLRQIIARQFFDSGSTRTDGRRGRNPVVVWQKDGGTVQTEFHEKPHFTSAEWWRQYWRATYKAPTLNTFRYGLFMGTIQAVLALGVGAPLAPIVFTFLFGTLIGTFMSTYRNWTYRGTASSQLRKSALISIAFALPVIIFTQGLSAFVPMHFTLAAFRKVLVNIGILFGNITLNNMGKVAWQAIPRMFEKYQHYQASQPLFWGFKTGDLLNQVFYHVNWTLRMFALLLPTLLGYAPLVIGIPVGMAASYWWAKRHQYPEAEQMFKKPRLWMRRVRDSLLDLSA